ncbi:MAG: tetratricopeptide repeat protein, partial [Thermomicrobiales bacterium]
MRAAIAWLRKSDDIERGLRLVGALGPFWFLLGFVSEGRAQICEFLDHPDADARTAARAMALTRVAWFAAWQNNFPEARQISEEALAIWREIGDPTSVPDTLIVLGMAVHRLDGPGRSRSTWSECVQLAQSVGDWLSLARALNNLAVLAGNEGRTDEATQLLQESLAISEEHGIQHSMSLALTNLGLQAAERGDIAQGEQQVQRSLRLCDSLRNMSGIASCLTVLATIAIMRGLPIRATRLTAAAETLLRHLNVLNNPRNSGTIKENITALRAALG